MLEKEKSRFGEGGVVSDVARCRACFGRGIGAVVVVGCLSL